jgi:hypothetical protein
MRRGKHKLFYHLFPEPENQEREEPKKRNYLMPERNIALVHRYYYHAVLRRLRYEDALELLSKNEFFLSEHRIVAVMQEPENYDLLTLLNHRKPDVKQLTALYPQWSWKYSAVV